MARCFITFLSFFVDEKMGSGKAGFTQPKNMDASWRFVLVKLIYWLLFSGLLNVLREDNDLFLSRQPYLIQFFGFSNSARVPRL